ncbi:MAG: hypothetical protein C0505_11525 [Leptothrix sp. (in: Bacteria)]|nr:hypothetical protein [Leptothrix sp. (in: b-proteobacteria)]
MPSFGISPPVAGLTTVALGTSTPEIAVSVGAVRGGTTDIAVGQVVGCNVFDILGCLGLSGLVAGGGLVIAPAVQAFDVWVMPAVTLACLPVFVAGRVIARWEGGLLLAYYAACVAFLLLAMQKHDALPAFGNAMLAHLRMSPACERDGKGVAGPVGADAALWEATLFVGRRSASHF